MNVSQQKTGICEYSILTKIYIAALIYGCRASKRDSHVIEAACIKLLDNDNIKKPNYQVNKFVLWALVTPKIYSKQLRGLKFDNNSIIFNFYLRLSD